MALHKSKAELFPLLHLLDDFSHFQLQDGFIQTLAEKDLRLRAPSAIELDESSVIPCVSIYDDSQPENTTALQQYFCSKSADDNAAIEQVFNTLSPVSHLSESRHKRHYRLVAFAEEEKRTPVAFVTFNVGLLDSWYSDDNTCHDRQIGGCCYLLYAYVVPKWRHLGVGSCLFHLISNLFWAQLQFIDAQAKSHNLTMVPLIYESEAAKGAEGLLSQVAMNINQYEALSLINDKASTIIKPCMSNIS
ncbi:hypothetical protein Shal_3473 [Shewanella halifaxensis HAW-EB4]|uniref:Uncharacterized protein n=1 Tax=Shewanella halifaxensis (strain HAW-EB4) TaxID=458817 RepID=B0TT77_SHEHH|nr:hypothetical protein [Shewanella halifaxensis]ABZ78018.1 hypothetical protein Shal_3473 [Shewanella halifaxensis HAW-EB4]